MIMKKQEIFEKVQSIVCETLVVDGDEVKEDSNLVNDLGADSLDTVELIMNVEKEFDIAVTDAKAEAVETVGDIVNLVEEMLLMNK